MHILYWKAVWRDPAGYVPGALGDNHVMLWNIGWVWHAFDNGSPGFWFPTAYWPSGMSFLFHTHTWLDSALGYLARPLLPSGVAGIFLWANINMLLATIASGLLVMVGLEQWGVRRKPLLLLGASALAFCWFRTLSATGHYHFFSTHWMLAALAAAARARRFVRADLRRPAFAWSLVSGLFVGLAALNDQTLAIFAAVLCAATFASCLRNSRSSIRLPLAALAVSGLVAAAVSAIHGIPLLMAAQDGRLNYYVASSDQVRVADCTSMLLPRDENLIWGRLVAPLRAKYGLRTGGVLFLGTVGILFAALGLFGSARWIRSRGRWARKQWAVVAGATFLSFVFALLACGERLQFGEHVLIELPTQFLRRIPIINNMRIPDRWVWPALLCFTLAGTRAVQALWGARWRGSLTAACLFLCAFAAAEGKWHPEPGPTRLDTDEVRIPRMIDIVRKEYVRGALLVMPIEGGFPHLNMLQLHWGYNYPIAAAYTARMPFDPYRAPVAGTEWTDADERWLREHDVSVILFPYHDRTRIREYETWIRKAHEAFPQMLILGQDGSRL